MDICFGSFSIGGLFVLLILGWLIYQAQRNTSPFRSRGPWL